MREILSPSGIMDPMRAVSLLRTSRSLHIYDHRNQRSTRNEKHDKDADLVLWILAISTAASLFSTFFHSSLSRAAFANSNAVLSGTISNISQPLVICNAVV